MRYRSVLAVCACACILLTTGPAQAASLAYEGFDYSNVGADLNGSNGGTGFSGAWGPGGFNASVFNSYDIAAGSLTSPGLVTTGNRAQTGANNAIQGLIRNFSTTLGADGTTRYLSVLLRPEGTLNQGGANGFFGVYLTNPAQDSDIFIGKPGGGAIGRYVVEDRGGSGQFASSTNAVVGETALLVLRMDYSSVNDLFTLYVNPGAVEPLIGDAVKTRSVNNHTGIVLYSNGAYSVDEIRIGETYADVVPQQALTAVPLPAPLLAGAALLTSFGLRRRSKATVA